MAIYTYFETWRPLIEGQSYKMTDAPAIEVKIPVGDTKYVILVIDGNNELKWTNEVTAWQYTNCSVERTTHSVYDKDSNRRITFQSNGYYITVTSEECLLQRTADGLETMELREYVVPELSSISIKKSVPTSTASTASTTYNGWVVPEKYTAIPSDIQGDTQDVSAYFGNVGYLNINFRYMKNADAMHEALGRVNTFGRGVDWIYYPTENSTVIGGGDVYVGIRQDTYTSCYYMTARGTEGLTFMLENLMED